MFFETKSVDVKNYISGEINTKLNAINEELNVRMASQNSAAVAQNNHRNSTSSASDQKTMVTSATSAILSHQVLLFKILESIFCRSSIAVHINSKKHLEKDKRVRNYRKNLTCSTALN